MKISRVYLLINIIILNIVLTNKMFAYGKATKSPKKPPVAKAIASNPPKEFTKWPKKGKTTDSKVKVKVVPTIPWKDSKVKIKVVPTLPWTKQPPTTVPVMEDAAVPSIPSTEWTTEMTPAKRIVSFPPKITPGKMIPSFSTGKTPAKVIASVSPMTEMAEAAVPSIPPTEWTTEMTPAKMIVSFPVTPGKMIPSFSTGKTPAKVIASVSPMTEMAEAAVPSIPPTEWITEMTPAKMIASFSSERTPGKMIASVTPENTPAKIIASFSPEMTPAKMIVSFPPEKVKLTTPQEQEAAAVPSIPPRTVLETTSSAAVDAAVPSVPRTTITEMTPAKRIVSFPPSGDNFEMDFYAVGTSAPPNPVLQTTVRVSEDAAVTSISTPENFFVDSEVARSPNIPLETKIETTSTETTKTTGTAAHFTVSLSSGPVRPAGDDTIMSLSGLDIQLDGLQGASAITDISESANFAQSQFANGLDLANNTVQRNDAPAEFSDSVNPVQSQTTNGLGGSETEHDTIQGGSALADISESVGMAQSQVNNGVEESSAAISNSVNKATEVDYPSYNDVKTLYAQLLGSYDTRVRPKLNQSDVTRVSVFFSLLNILEFKTAEQTFDILGYFYFVWEDEFLTWRPRHFSRIQWIKVPMPEIWTPQFLIANMYSGDSKIGDSTDRVLVTFRGKVSWVPEATYKIVCEVEIEYYPFDKQTCKMTFHVSDDMASEVDIYANAKHNGIRTDHYIENSKWRLINASVEKYFVNDVSYMDVIFVVQRRIEFIFFSTVAPLLLVSILNVCAFLIPVESREKGEYSATIVITYGVFISHICASIPPNSTTIPYFLLYMIWMLGFSVSTVMYAIIQSRMYSHHRNHRIRIGLLTMCFGTKVKSSDDADAMADVKVKSKIETNIEEVTDADNKILLCGDFLKKLDIMMIVLYVLSIIGTTSYFFFSMNLVSVLT